jgi:hypothetical protein
MKTTTSLFFGFGVISSSARRTLTLLPKYPSSFIAFKSLAFKIDQPISMYPGFVDRASYSSSTISEAFSVVSFGSLLDLGAAEALITLEIGVVSEATSSL